MRRLVKMFDREQVGLDLGQAVVFFTVIMAIPAMLVVSAFVWVSNFVFVLTLSFCTYLLVLDELYLGLCIIYTRGRWGQYLNYLVASFVVLLLLLFLIIAPFLA